MNENEILKSLKNFKKVTPRVQWLNRNRDILMSVIHEDFRRASARTVLNKIQKETSPLMKRAHGVFGFFLPAKRTVTMLKPAGFFLTFTIALLTSGIFTVSAAQNTLPGDTLYNVKIVSEKVQKVLTTSDEEKAKLDMVFAGKRIQELEKIIDTPDEADVTSRKVDTVLQGFEENVTSAQVKLAAISQTDKHENATSLAKDIDEKASEYKKTLEKSAEAYESQVGDVVKKKEVKDKVQKAADLAGETSDASFNVIIEKHVSGAVPLTEEEIARTIDKKWNEVNELIVMVGGQIDGFSATTTDSLFDDENSDVATSTGTSTDYLFLAKEQRTAAVTALEEAQASIAAGDINAALTKLNECRALILDAKESITTYIAEMSEEESQREQEGGEIPVDSDMTGEEATSTDTTANDDTDGAEDSTSAPGSSETTVNTDAGEHVTVSDEFSQT